MTNTDPASEAIRALDHGHWEVARAAFEKSLAQNESAEALDGLARALWWLGDFEGAIRHRARAFTAYRSAGDVAAAARIAFWLAREYRVVVANPAAANGWLARGENLVAESPRGPAPGWLDLARAQATTDPAEQERHADSAYRISREFADPDLEIYALAARGLARITEGLVDVGITDLDAALATATDASSIDTVGDTLCTLMRAAELVGDADRFAQWNHVLEQYLTSHQHLNLTGFCFTCCGEIFVIDGRWDAADEQFRAAIAALEQTGHRSRCAHPVTRLARLRIHQGRFEEAEALLSEFHHLPEAVEPRAALQLTRGHADAARNLLERRLRQLGPATLPAAPLLSLLVEAWIAAGAVDRARQAGHRLTALAERSGLDRIRGLAALASGRVARATGRFDDAGAAFDAALAAFQRAAMPMDAAVTHLELARLAAAGQPDVAAEEARAALHGFEELGAAWQADQAAAMLRRLGIRGITGRRGLGLLTRREQEVLHLVAQGLTNSEIADRLFISTKTAGNHVSNVLTKLGVRTRTEAAAQALRHPSTT